MAKLPAARDSSVWVRSAPGAADSNFVQLNTDTQISFSIKRDESKEDYRGATNKVSFLGIPDITISLQVSRTEDDAAYDEIVGAVDAGTALDIQIRDGANKVYAEGAFNILEDTETYGLNESVKVALSLSAAGPVTITRAGRTLVTV